MSIKDVPGTNLTRVVVGAGDGAIHQVYFPVDQKRRARQVERDLKAKALQVRVRRGRGTAVAGVGIEMLLDRRRTGGRPTFYVTVANRRAQPGHNPQFPELKRFNCEQMGYREAWAAGCRHQAQILGLSRAPRQWLAAIPDESYLKQKLNQFNKRVGRRFQLPAYLHQ